MGTKIRMKRGGRTHSPYYRIVVIDQHSRARGRELDIIGLYQPCAKPEPRVEVDKKNALEWLRKGAQPTDTARNVLSKLGVMEMYAAGTKPEDLPDEAPAAEEAETAVAETADA